MAIDKPAIGSSDWGLKVNAALDELDLKETIDGAETKASQAYESATEYTDARLNELDIPSGADVLDAKNAAVAAGNNAQAASTAAIAAASSASTANASASAAANSAAQAINASDATVADRVTSGSLTGVALAAKILTGISDKVGGYAIEQAILTGETLSKDLSADASVILQRAVNNAGDIYDATGIPQQVTVGRGRYRIDTYITPRSGVGIKGAGRAVTSFHPQGTNPFFRGGFDDTIPYAMLADIVFEDFTVNCYSQTDTAYNAAVKAFYIQNMLRPTFARINCIGSWASQFGCDFMIEAKFVDCYSKDSGRGIPPDANGTGSGFAVGVGRYANESYRFINCVAETGKGSGWFFERLETRGADQLTPSVTIIGGSAQDNVIGVNDCGVGGINAHGLDVYRNTLKGWLVKAGNSSTVGGRDGNIIGGRFWKNGGAGVEFSGVNQGGGYRIIESQFIENVGAGIKVVGSSAFSYGALTIRGNAFIKNGTPGVDLEGTSLPLRTPVIEGNEFDGNTTAGIRCAASAFSPTICRNRFTDHRKTAVQATGLLVTATTWTTPRVQGNLFQDQATGMSGTSGFSQTSITDNITTTSPTSYTIWSDSFTRADGTITTTEVGSLPYSVLGAGVAAVASNKLAITGATTQTRVIVASGSSDGVFKVKMDTLSSTKEQSITFRYIDASNELILTRVSGADLHYRFAQRVSGTLTTITALSPLMADGDLIEVRLAGTSVEILINAVSVYSGTVSANLTGKSYGVSTTGTTAFNARFDDLSFAAAV